MSTKENTDSELPASAPLAALTPFEMRDGDVSLFVNKKPTGPTDYHFWGKAVTLDGQAMVMRLWKEKAAKSGKDYFKGYCLNSLEEMKGLEAPKDDSHANYTVLFYNDQFDPAATEKKKPIYTGILKDGENTLQLSLWNRMGAKGEFFSGKMEHKQEAKS